MGDIRDYSVQWFVHKFQDGLEEAFYIRYLPGKLLNEFLGKCTIKRDIGNGKFSEDLDAERFNDLIVGHCLVDWKGVSRNGKHLKCTRDNRMEFAENKPDRINWIVNTAQNPAAYRDGINLDDIKKKLGLLSGTHGKPRRTRQSKAAGNV